MMSQVIRGLAYYCGDYVNTDVMSPGRFEPYSGPDHLASIALIDYESTIPFVDANKGRSDFTVIFAGAEFGCGSSRETAPQALHYAGARVVIARSFARIFYRNCVNMGLLLPITFDHGFDESVIGKTAEVDLQSFTFTVGGQVFHFADFGPLADIIAAGGLINYSKQEPQDRKKASRMSERQAPPQSITHKILARGSGRPFVTTGEIVDVDVDMCFTHDPVLEGLRDLFYKEYSKDATVWDPSRIALFQDHLVPAKDKASQRLMQAMDRFAAEQGIQHYYPYGENYGICHILMCEKGHVRPGEIVIGTDSHSVTYGAFNAFGTGIGMVDMLKVFRTGRLWFIVPEVIHVRIDGRLRPGVLAKDIILRIIGEIGMDGASYKTMEFSGSTIDEMSAEERMTLCNMVVEAGAKNGVMTLNESAKQYLMRATSREFDSVVTDSDFVYSGTLAFQAEEIEPMIAYPHSPANVHPISQAKAERIRIDQVYVGSCTGAKFNDIETVATLLRDKKIARTIRMMVVPATMDIYRKIAETGIMTTLLQAGAVIESPGCKACYGAHGGVPGDGETCLSTTNRNFRGRMGNPRSFVYLASPFVAAATALSGYITDEIE
jgi:homoaconitate hydratase family protein